MFFLIFIKGVLSIVARGTGEAGIPSVTPGREILLEVIVIHYFIN